MKLTANGRVFSGTSETPSGRAVVIKTGRMQAVEAEHGARDIRAILSETYARTESIRATCQTLGISQPTFRRWLHDLGGRILWERDRGSGTRMHERLEFR